MLFLIFFRKFHFQSNQNGCCSQNFPPIKKKIIISSFCILFFSKIIVFMLSNEKSWDWWKFSRRQGQITEINSISELLIIFCRGPFDNFFCCKIDINGFKFNYTPWPSEKYQSNKLPISKSHKFTKYHSFLIQNLKWMRATISVHPIIQILQVKIVARVLAYNYIKKCIIQFLGIIL